MILQRKLSHLNYFLLHSALSLTTTVCCLSSCLKQERFNLIRPFLVMIIRNLDSEKAHGHDKISTWMFKICDPLKCKPPEMIFKPCLERRIFPVKWPPPHTQTHIQIHKLTHTHTQTHTHTHKWQTVSSKHSANCTNYNMWKNVWQTF